MSSVRAMRDDAEVHTPRSSKPPEEVHPIVRAILDGTHVRRPLTEEEQRAIHEHRMKHDPVWHAVHTAPRTKEPLTGEKKLAYDEYWANVERG